MDEPDFADETRMSLGEHLEELRWRILWGLATLVVCFLAVFFLFRDWAMARVADPIVEALAGLDYEPVLIALRPQDRFLAYVKVSGLVSLLLASPVIIYHLWQFVAAGLYQHERRYVGIIFPFSAVSFILGVLFAYFVLVRFGLRFLYSFGDDTLIRTTPTVQENIDFVIKLSLVMGVVFQLPLVLLGLEKMGVVTVKQLSAGRRYALLGCVVLGMVLTDPSAVTQLMLAGPMYALYEIGILLCRWFG
jgi:sec-independent protein translocase protein TatC